MNVYKSKYLRLSTLILFMMSSAGEVYSVDNTYRTETSKIGRMVEKIKSEPNSQEHYFDSLKLEELICATPIADISDADIDLLISFVKTGSDDDRATGAEALASIGPKASRAASVLQEALKNSQAYEDLLRSKTGGTLTGILSTDIIKQALGIIKGDIHKGCRSEFRGQNSGDTILN